MDFELPPEDDPRRVAARSWLRDHPSPSGRALAEAGFVAPHFPAPWGLDADPIHQLIVDDELRRARVSRPSNPIGIGWAGPTILAAGTEEQKERYLFGLLSGEDIWCQLFSEPGAGSDLATLGTRAVRDGDEWIVNGQKIWTSGAHYSDWGILVTRSDPTVPKHKGLTYFFLNMKTPGIEIKPIKQISGGANFNEVYFTDVRIPDSQRLGAVGQGWQVSLTTLMNERASIGAGGAGVNFNLAYKLAQKVMIDDRPAIEDRAVRARLANWYVEEAGLKYTGYRTMTAMSRGQTPGPENSIGKAVGAPKTQDMASFCMDLLEMSGAINDPEIAEAAGLIQLTFMAAPGGRIAGGTDEILLNILAERVLGLPQDVRVDKGIPFNEVPTGRG